jgi:hypothetical protein
MNDLKITISRSFSRKLNLGNYESADFFANYSQEIPESSDKIAVANLSEMLFQQAKADVEKSMSEYQKYQDVDPDTRREMEKTDWLLTELSAKVRKGEPIMVSEWEKLTTSQQQFLHKFQLQKIAEDRAKQKDEMSDAPSGVSSQAGNIKKNRQAI